MAVLAAWSWAQDPPPQEKPAEPPQEEETVIPVRWNSATVGFTTWWSNGNLARLHQYGRVPSGLHLADLSVLSPGSGAEPWVRAAWRGNPGQDSLGEGLLIFNSGQTAIRAQFRNRHYYSDVHFAPTDPSEDKVGSVTVQHAIAPNVGAFASYRGDERDQRHIAPNAPGHSRTRTIAGGIEGKGLGGQLGLTIAERTFRDDSGFQPTTLQRRFDAHYAADLGATLSLEGRAGYTRIEQAGRPSGDIRTLALGGYWDVGPRTGVQFNLGKEDLDIEDIVRNAYVRERFTTSARLNHKFGDWGFQFGFRHRESERVRADRSFVDVPKWNTYDARLSGRFGNGMRLTLKGNWDDLTASATPTGTDPRQLWWDDKAMFQAKLDGGNEKFSGYGSYSVRYRQNQQRDMDVTWHSFSIGGSYQFTDAILGWGEWTYDSLRARGVEDPAGDSLDTYFPDSMSMGFGLDWVRNPKETISASLNAFATNNVRGTQLTLQYRRQISDDHSLDLVVAPWRYEDRLYGLTGYDATFLAVRYTVKF